MNKRFSDDIPVYDSFLIEEDIDDECKRKKGKIRGSKFFGFVFWGLVLVFCFVMIFRWVYDSGRTSSILDDINDLIEVREVTDGDGLDDFLEDDSDYWYFMKVSLLEVDFDKLKERNEDTVGWINVNNTNINYPYVQNSDNSFYLNHSFDKSYNEAGWVFLDYRNDESLSSKNNIL